MNFLRFVYELLILAALCSCLDGCSVRQFKSQLREQELRKWRLVPVLLEMVVEMGVLSFFSGGG